MHGWIAIDPMHFRQSPTHYQLLYDITMEHIQWIRLIFIRCLYRAITMITISLITIFEKFHIFFIGKINKWHYRSLGIQETSKYQWKSLKVLSYGILLQLTITWALFQNEYLSLFEGNCDIHKIFRKISKKHSILGVPVLAHFIDCPGFTTRNFSNIPNPRCYAFYFALLFWTFLSTKSRNIRISCITKWGHQGNRRFMAQRSKK